MYSRSLFVLLGATVTIMSTSACSHHDSAPPVGSLTRSLNLVDTDGRVYGHVDMDPVGGGKVFDSSGRLIGDIVPPDK